MTDLIIEENGADEAKDVRLLQSLPWVAGLWCVSNMTDSLLLILWSPRDSTSAQALALELDRVDSA